MGLRASFRLSLGEGFRADDAIDGVTVEQLAVFSVMPASRHIENGGLDLSMKDSLAIANNGDSFIQLNEARVEADSKGDHVFAINLNDVVGLNLGFDSCSLAFDLSHL